MSSPMSLAFYKQKKCWGQRCWVFLYKQKFHNSNLGLLTSCLNWYVRYAIGWGFWGSPWGFWGFVKSHSTFSSCLFLSLTYWESVPYKDVAGWGFWGFVKSHLTLFAFFLFACWKVLHIGNQHLIRNRRMGDLGTLEIPMNLLFV